MRDSTHDRRNTQPIGSDQAPGGFSQTASPTIRSDAETIINSTEPGVVLGTPAYMAPEQVRGEPVDHRADLFAFGCVLYEMLEGKRAFKRETAVETMNAILTGEPPELADGSPNVSPDIERVVRRCLEKRPENRFQSASDLGFSIENASNKFQNSGHDFSPSAAADGTRVCFSSDRDGTRKIWVKDLASGLESPLTTGPDDFPRFSPDGSKVLFTRAFGIKRSLFRIASNIRGEPNRIVDDVISGDWSPDARQVAFIRWTEDGGSSLFIAGIDGSAEKSLHRFTFRGTAARWSPDGKTIAVTINDSSRPQSIGLPNGNMIMDARSSRENLKELPLGTVTTTARSLTLGNSTDRQPTYSPDGTEVAFSSNRSGNLELWSLSRKTGIVHRLTDDPADDWDPAYSSDGKRLIWSANRTGNLEIWIANADGSAPVQVTHDGFAAENPTMTRDGQWIVYGSTHPEKAGIWKIHPDGTGATRLNQSTTAGNAEVSPDGRHAAYLDNKHTSLVIIKILEIESGAELPFAIQVELRKETGAILGRVRWMPNGKSLVFLGQDEGGVNGLYVQDFVPGEDTSKSRRPIGGFDPENSAESFGISPDGQFITIATWEQFFSIMMTENLPTH